MLGAIFDLDGTLVDSLGKWKQINYDFFDKFNIPPNDEVMHKFKSLSLADAAKLVRDLYSIDCSNDDIVQTWIDMAHDMYTNHVKLKPHAETYLRTLKEQGVKLGVATATYNHLATACLDANGILDLFDFVIDVNTYNTSKHEPDIYFTASEMLGVPIENCVIFEDAPYAIKTANDAGFKVICIRDLSWGDEQSEVIDYYEKIIDSYIEL